MPDLFDPPIEAVALRWPERETWLPEPDQELSEAWGDAVWGMLVVSMLQRGDVDPELLGRKWPSVLQSWPNPRVCVESGTTVGAEYATADQMIAWLDGIHGKREKVGHIRRLSRVWLQRRPPAASVISLPGCRGREVEAWKLFVNHASDEGMRIAFTDPILLAWFDLRRHYQWTFEEEDAVVRTAMETRLTAAANPPFWVPGDS